MTPKRFVLTGASGIVGGEVCRALLARGHRVAALLRPGRAPRDAAGNPLRGAEVVACDLLRPGLGLDAAARRALRGADGVVHAAAVTGFAAPDGLLRATNVGGALGALALAEALGAPLLHVSTAYVCGAAEGAVAEAPSPAEPRFHNGYEATKAGAERALLAAPRSVPLAVARPSIVLGRHADGAVGRFDGAYALLRLAGEGRLRTLPAAPGASLDLVPLCHVAEALADLAEMGAGAAGRVVHVTSGAPVPLASLCALAREFPGFHAPRLVAPEAFDAASLPPEERWWHGQVARLFAPYLRPSPVFEARALRALTGRECPPVDAAFLARCAAFAIGAGFLRPDQRMSG